ncbi:hypothetical protein BJ912DRAFT_468236 [Pholiota molesta]|nr:hypothetical protein BJ912DRAFT_468236 [Pholiota molesta]
MRVSNATTAVEEEMDDSPGAVRRRRRGRRCARAGVTVCGADSPMQELLTCVRPETAVRRRRGFAGGRLVLARGMTAMRTARWLRDEDGPSVPLTNEADDDNGKRMRWMRTAFLLCLGIRHRRCLTESTKARRQAYRAYIRRGRKALWVVMTVEARKAICGGKTTLCGAYAM